MPINALHSSEGPQEHIIVGWPYEASHYFIHSSVALRWVYLSPEIQTNWNSRLMNFSFSFPAGKSNLCIYNVYTSGLWGTYNMQTVYISIHLGSCVVLLQAEDVQTMCMHCDSKESDGSSASYLHSAGERWRNVTLRVWRLIVVSTGTPRWDQICLSDLLLSCRGIWRCTQTSRQLHASLHVHGCLCVVCMREKLQHLTLHMLQVCECWRQSSVSLYMYNMCPQ